jgi:hypothetical protein
MNDFHLKDTWENKVIRLVKQTVESSNKREYGPAFEPLLNFYNITYPQQWEIWQKGIFDVPH